MFTLQVFTLTIIAVCIIVAVRVEFKWVILTTILDTILEFFYRGRIVMMQNRPPESL